ncbi:TolC family protein [Bacteroides nordii]|uniref:TolC family protein n=1 Tax=Bacteroides nordii TaxID=291645 RepID=UPI0018985D2E|nr:TolC family protein [Bacteroides nordii]
MKHFCCLYSFSILLLCTVPSLMKAQEANDYSRPEQADYTKITLPPLDSLFENAKGGPTYELAQVKEQIERKLLAKEKKAFLGFFSLRGSYQYGMFGNEGTYTDVAIAPYLTYTTQAQRGYTVGAGVNIPIDGLFDLKARVNRQKLAVKSAALEKEIKYEEMKREIIEMYTTATSQLSVLKLRAEALELATLQYEIAEKNFSNSTIDTGDLSVEKQRQSTAMEAYEKSKFELTKSLMMLEVITRTPILRK